MSRTPTLAEAIAGAIEAQLAELHTALPAEVVKYDNAAQTVDVQPLIKRVLSDDEGNELVESLPQVRSVPLAFPRAGGFFVSFPVQKGDTVLLVFSERSLGRWRKDAKEVDPGDLRHHSLADAVAIPGLFATNKALPSADADTASMVMGKSGGPHVVVTSSGVELGGTASSPPTDFVALAQKVLTELTRIQTYMTVLDTALRVPAAEPGNGAPSAFQTALGLALAAVTYPAPASMASTKVKAL